MIYNNVLTVHYSGTGNSFRVARWIDQAASEGGAACTLQSINSPYPEMPGGSQTLTAVVFPTHGLTAPWPVIRFAMRLPRQQGTHAMVAATRGGTKFGPLIVPGLEGTAAWLIALILRVKGFRIRGVKGISMPANWTAVMPGYGEENSRRIIASEQPAAMAFIRNVLSGQRQLRGWIPLLVGMLFAPVSLGYLFLGRFFLAKTLYASNRCNGCGQCAKHCPSNAIRMRGGKEHERPYWTFSCHSCMRCMNLCPQNAIEMNYTLAAAMIWLSTLSMDVLLLRWLGQFIVHSSLTVSGPVQVLVKTIFLFGMLWVLYAFFHLILSIPWFNRLVTMLSLSHYYSRYHEPDTDLKKM